MGGTCGRGCGPGGHRHGQDDRQQLGHGQVPSRAVDEAQQGVSAVGLGHVREQEVSGRERVDRERVERALFGAVVRLYMAVVDLGEAVQHRAGARVVADLQHVESTRVVGCLCVCFRQLRECRVLARPSSTGAARPCINTRPLFPMEHVLGGLPGGAHRGETGPVDGLNDGITAPEHLGDILPVARHPASLIFQHPFGA